MKLSLTKKIAYGGLLAVVLAVSVYIVHLRGQIRRHEAESAAAVREAALKIGGLQATIANDRVIAEHLAKPNLEFLQRLQKVSKDVHPAVHVGSSASVADTVTLGPTEDRFVLSPDMKTLARRQAFALDVLVLRNADGKFDVGRVVLAEVDPETKRPLDPQPDFAVESNIQVGNGLGDLGPKPFHPRLVAGIENHGYPLVGAELLNGERLGGLLSHVNVSLLARYNPRDKNLDGGVAVGWRLFGNVTVAPAFFYPAKQVGAMVTVELTR